MAGSFGMYPWSTTRYPPQRKCCPERPARCSRNCEGRLDGSFWKNGWQVLSRRHAQKISKQSSLSAEELLAVAAAVGAESAAEAFCDEAEMLLPWLPAEWAHIADRARHRVHALAGQASLVIRLWGAVEDAGTAALVREGAPSVRPASRLTDDLIPQQPRWFTWRDQIADLGTRATAAATTWLDRSIQGLTVTALSPTMGGSDVANDECAVRGRPASGPPHYRVFVVDAENPEGFDVTGKFTEADGDLWRLNENEQAVVVIIAGATALAGSSFEQVLKEASTRGDVVARTRVLQPTHATKARR